MLLMLVLACSPPPPLQVTRKDLEVAHATGNIQNMCTALTMKDDEVREYAAEKLKDFKDNGATCVCEHAKKGTTWDKKILDGLRDATRDDRVGCIADLLDDPALEDRPGLATAMLRIKAPRVKARLLKAALEDPDPNVQVAALGIMRGTKDPKEVELLIAGVRKGGAYGATAALNLAGNPAARDVLREAAVGGDVPTRIAALSGYRDTKPEDWAEVACTALDDPDLTIRNAALGAVSSTRNEAILGCINTRMNTLEPDSGIRTAMLEMLAKDASPVAAKILCDTIPFWVKTYVTDTAPTPKSDLDIVYYQNDRDFENSLACVEAAFKKGGYTPCGKAYLGARVNEFGGKARYTGCGDSAGAAPSNVVEF